MASMPGRRFSIPISLRFTVTGSNAAAAQENLNIFIEKLGEALARDGVQLLDNRDSTGMIELEYSVQDPSIEIQASLALATPEPTIGAGSSGDGVTWRRRLYSNFASAPSLDIANYADAEIAFNKLGVFLKKAAALAVKGDALLEPAAGIQLN